LEVRLGGLRCVVISDREVLQELFRREECSGRAPLFLTHGIMQARLPNSHRDFSASSPFDVKVVT